MSFWDFFLSEYATVQSAAVFSACTIKRRAKHMNDHNLIEIVEPFKQTHAIIVIIRHNRLRLLQGLPMTAISEFITKEPTLRFTPFNETARAYVQGVEVCHGLVMADREGVFYGLKQKDPNDTRTIDRLYLYVQRHSRG